MAENKTKTVADVVRGITLTELDRGLLGSSYDLDDFELEMPIVVDDERVVFRGVHAPEEQDEFPPPSYPTVVLAVRDLMDRMPQDLPVFVSNPCDQLEYPIIEIYPHDDYGWATIVHCGKDPK